MMSATDLGGTVTVAAIGSFIASLLIVVTQGWHGKHSLDKDVAGIQKFHKTPVPRIGGIAVLIGILVAAIFPVSAHTFSHEGNGGSLFMLVLSGMPAFLAGIVEDVTKRVSVKARLLATFSSALLACWLLGAYLPRLDMWGVDTLLQASPLAAIVITAVAVGGVANSINIIDGFNGIAGSAVMIMLAALGFLAWTVDDVFVTYLAMLGVGATSGFLLMNYPTGRLFMGDGGAYFVGFWLAEVAVLLVIRNPEINTWQVLAVCAYPVTEVLYSMYRRKFIRKTSPGAPDRLHLHTLVYRRVVCQLLPRNDDKPWIRNAAVACITATWITVIALSAVWFGGTVPSALIVIAANLVSYIAIYTRLVRGHWCLNPVVALGFLRSRPAIRELP
jgi:UDP-N-acetylmuramyl pentapeptide phosphotransferase/UDP-N-acetylglucosamine-1-phosphate transferase